MVTKDKAKHILSNVGSHHHFKLYDGTHIKNLFELQNKLLSMDSDTFIHHVNSHKNDFASWILHVLKDEELYMSIVKVKERSLLYSKVKKRIRQLNVLASIKVEEMVIEKKAKKVNPKKKRSKPKKNKSEPKKEDIPKKKVIPKKDKPKKEDSSDKKTRSIKVSKKKAKPKKSAKAESSSSIRRSIRPKKRKSKAKYVPIEKLMKGEVHKEEPKVEEIKPRQIISNIKQVSQSHELIFKEHIKSKILEFGFGLVVGLILGLIIAKYVV